MTCPHCESTATTKRPDQTELGYRRFRCRDCRRGFNERTGTPFNRLQYPTDVVCLVVLWRFRYKLSLRDLAEMFLQRGIVLPMKPCGSGRASWLRSSARPCASGATVPWARAGMSMRRISKSRDSSVTCTVRLTAMAT
jgi:hypothetical protein